MKIKIKFKENKIFLVNRLVFDNMANRIEFTKRNIEHLNYLRGETEIEVPEEDLRCATLEELEVYDLELGEEYTFAHIEEISFRYVSKSTGKEVETYLYSSSFRNFQLVYVPVFGNITGASYDILARFIRDMDKKENALNALENFEAPENVKFALKKDIETFAEEFDEVTNYTGSDEFYMIENSINKRGGVIYTKFLTEDEEYTVPILKTHLEECKTWIEKKESQPPVVYDDLGEEIDLRNIIEIHRLER